MHLMKIGGKLERNGVLIKLIKYYIDSYQALFQAFGLKY